MSMARLIAVPLISTLIISAMLLVLDRMLRLFEAGRQFETRIIEELRAVGLEKQQIHVVGDAFAPRRLANALVEAHTVARNIGSRSRM